MHVGGLRRVFMLEKRIAADSVDAGQSLAWSSVCEVWGALESVPLHGSVFNNEKANGATHCITLRFRDDIDFDSGKSLVSGARRFVIRGLEILGDAEKWARLWVEEA